MLDMLDTNNAGNYRPITLSSIFAKLAELLVPISFEASDTQFGFRQGRCTLQACALIHDTMRMMNHGGSPVYICTLDAEKCFDCIWHDGLFFKLMNIIPSQFWLFLYNWYRSLKTVVRWEGSLGEIFAVTKGTRQGSLLSPSLFNIFIDSLLRDLKTVPAGVRLDSFHVNSVAYADDVTLIASSVPDLQSLIDACACYARTWCFKYGIKKSKCMVAGSHSFQQEPIWTLEKVPIDRVEEMEILGVTFSSHRSSSAHIAKRKGRCSKAFYSLSQAGMLNPGLQPSVKSYLWGSVCRPALVYGCESVALSPRELKELESTQGTLIKRCLHIGKRSHHTPLLSALNIPSLERSIATYACRLYNSVMQIPSPCRDLYVCLAARYLANRQLVPGTLPDRLKAKGLTLFNPVMPLEPPSDDNGLVDSLRTILSNENFLKPYSDELVILRLLTRAF